jgi:hypothetical protein
MHRVLLKHIRRVVIWTGSFAPFHQFYKALYLLSIRIIGYAFRPERESLCILHSSLSDPHWIPGISDIDVILIVRMPQGNRKFPFLTRLWLRYQKLRSFLPHFCHLEIVDERSFYDLGRSVFGPMSTARAYDIENFRGSADLLARVQSECLLAASELSATDHLRNAILRFINFHLPINWTLCQNLSYPDRVALKHLQDKFVVLLSRCQKWPDTARPQAIVDDSTEWFAASLRMLEHAARAEVETPGSTTRLPHSGGRLDARLRPYVEKVDGWVNRVGSGHVDAVIWRESHVGRRWTMAFVVRLNQGCADRATLNALRMFLSCIRLDPELFTVNPHQWSHQLPYPLVFTSSSWRAWLACYPLNAFFINRARSVAYATGSLPIQAPRQSDYLRFANVQLGVWNTNRNQFDLQNADDAGQYFLEVAELARLTNALVKGRATDVDDNWSPPCMDLEEADQICTESLAALASTVVHRR